MDGRESFEEDDRFELGSPFLLVGVAISGSRSSKYLVHWALDKFVPEADIIVKLIHVCSKISAVPTPMGNLIPISQVREDVAAAYQKEMEWKTNEMLLPYKKMCVQRKVEVDLVVVESEDVPNALANEISKLGIKKLVIGASSRGMFARKQKGLSTKISTYAPNFCAVYTISKGKLSFIRPADTETVGSRSSRDDSSDTQSIVSDSSYASSSQTGYTDRGSVSSSSNFRSSSLTMQRYQALATMNQSLVRSKRNSLDSHKSRNKSMDFDRASDDAGSCPSTSWASDRASTFDAVTDCSSSDSQININFELEKLRIELRHAKGMYAMARSENNDASRKLKDLNARLSDEGQKLRELNVKEEEAKRVMREDKEKQVASKRQAYYVNQCVEREAGFKREAETKAISDAREKEKIEMALSGSARKYRDFTWEEIESATSQFSEDLKIGMGGFGTIYKCIFHHTTVAVKVLHSDESHRSKQFQKELEILSNIYHPHLLLLVGACPDRGCLVYEYMENGSLDDRLARRNGTPPIPWFDRFRIAWEVASALAFLHSSKPDPIVHRDLKPANILLDCNLVSKIGDVGLATMIQPDQTCGESGPVGTMCYIDPEYQRTGQYSPESDVYALGMVILQLLTARPAVALLHAVETAVNDGKLAALLDSSAGNWPTEETQLLAELGLGCVELRRRDRPNLREQVLPSLLSLKEVVDKARDSGSKLQKLPPPPSHFICPIIKDVMSDPCVAADGYTYERKAMDLWLAKSETSPMTNLPLPNKKLIANYTLLSAIMEWKSKRT